MNEFIAKKIGEAIAFEEHAIWILKKAEKAFGCFMTDIEIQGKVGDHEKNRDTLLSISETKDVKEVVEKKVEATKKKLEGMADTYIGEKWDDTAEVLEWSSFAEGAAIAHWGIVKGAGEGLGSEEILAVCYDAIAEHGAFFDEVADELGAIGNKQALDSKSA